MITDDVRILAEKAAELYNANSSVATIQQANAVVESLRMFVQAYKLFVQAYQVYDDVYSKPHPIWKPKILMFIALCNYKIDNINRAYCIAKQGIDAVNWAIKNSEVIGFNRSMYGSDTLEELINFIEEKRYDEVIDSHRYTDIDPTEIDTHRLELLIHSINQSFQPTKEQIKDLINKINTLQSNMREMEVQLSDNNSVILFIEELERFKMPLYYAWRGYKYGWHTDFCEEGDSLFPFMLFERDIKGNIQKLINILHTQSPFAQDGSMLTESLISVYQKFLQDLQCGIIRFA